MALKENALTGEISVVTTTWKWWLCTAALLLFIGGVGANLSPNDATFIKRIGQLSVLGLFVPYTIWRALGGSQRLEIKRAGFSVETPLKSHWFGWDEITNFALIDVNLAGLQKGKVIAFQRKDGRVEQLNWGGELYGNLNAIVLPNPGLKPGSLVALMNDARRAGLTGGAMPKRGNAVGDNW